MDTFQQTFVDSFDEESQRQNLFGNYSRYMDDLSGLIKYSFFQWIDGSYVSNKRKPKDIDLVTVLDYRDYEESKANIERKILPHSLEGRNTK